MSEARARQSPTDHHLDILQQAALRAAAQDDPESVAHAQYWLGYLYYGLGESRLAIAHCETALRAALNTANDPLTVQIRATLGQALAVIDGETWLFQTGRDKRRPASNDIRFFFDFGMEVRPVSFEE